MRTTEASRPGKSRLDHCEYSAIFGPPPVFEEEEKSYEQFLTEVSRAVVPGDLLEKIWVHDFAYHTIEGLRLRRITRDLMMVNRYKGLAEALVPLVGRLRAQTLADGWAAQKPDVVEEVNKTLTSAGLNSNSILAQTFAVNLDLLERLQQLIALSEDRRNAALHEIHRHRQTLAQTLRQAAQELEDRHTRFLESAPIDRTTVK
jgi:hypothetical protein